MSEGFWVSYAGLWAVVVLLAMLVILLYRHIGLSIMASAEGHNHDGIAVGRNAPAFVAKDQDGMDVEWSPARLTPHLLVFTAPNCAPCERLLPRLNTIAATAGDRFTITDVNLATPEMLADVIARHRPRFPALADGEQKVASLFEVRVTPFAFVIGADGTVASKGLCNTADRLGHLLRAAGVDFVPPDDSQEPSLLALSSGGKQ